VQHKRSLSVIHYLTGADGPQTTTTRTERDRRRVQTDYREEETKTVSCMYYCVKNSDGLSGRTIDDVPISLIRYLRDAAKQRIDADSLPRAPVGDHASPPYVSASRRKFAINGTAHDAVLAVNVHVSALVSAYANQTKLRYQLENLSLG
jgi:hypothetical protein